MELGSIKTVALKELWPGEATRFTPWLATNLDVLGKKLGMDLELESTRASVRRILCRHNHPPATFPRISS